MKMFGHKKTPQELLKENQRSLNKVIRELDREKLTLEKQEKKIIFDIKKAAKDGQMDVVKIMAKDLVRTKQFSKKLIITKANIQAVSLNIATLKSQGAMMQAMQGVTKAMHQMNQQMKLPQIQKIMADFERQSEMLNMKGEMMEDMIDGGMADAGDEEESDAIVKQVFEELGLELNEELGGLSPAVDLPGTSKVSAVKTGANADADLEARLNSLRRD